MKRNYNKELNAAFNAVKCLDNKNCSEKELADAVDWFRIAATEYANHVVRYAPGIEAKRMALRDCGKDDEYAFAFGLSKLLFDGLDLQKKKKNDATYESLEDVDLANLYYTTFKKIHRINNAPASYIYRIISNGLIDYYRERDLDEISIHVVIGDENDGTELEELGRVDGKVIAAASAEDEIHQKNGRNEMDLILTDFLKKLAETNALGFVAFSTCLEPNSHGEINGRCKNQKLSKELAFYMNQALEKTPDRRKAVKTTAENFWNEAISRYESMHFDVEMITMPKLFSETVSHMVDLGDKNRAHFGAAADDAKELLKPYCNILAEIMNY